MKPARFSLKNEIPQSGVLIVDSGAGALNFLGEIRQLLPDSSLIALADHAEFPYGDKSDEQIIERLLELTERCIELFSPSTLVIACNTASTIALPALRRAFNIPVVGTVPAVKPAALHSKSKVIAVLATPATVSSSYLDELIAEHAEGCDVLRIACPDLASLAERKLCGEAVSVSELQCELAPLINHEQYEQVDTLVFACTHFSFLQKEIIAVIAGGVQIIDPAIAVARQVQRVHLQRDSDVPCDGGYLLTTSKKSLYQIPMLRELGIRKVNYISM